MNHRQHVSTLIPEPNLHLSNMPARTSPAYSLSPSPLLGKNLAEYDPSQDSRPGSPPPNILVSPAFTPPATPGAATPSSFNDARSIPVAVAAAAAATKTVEQQQQKPQKLLPRLPRVDCVVRARIPTITGAEMFLHLYHNDVDDKEHLAIVFGPHIRSRSLDAARPGETEMDRMIRGAYQGRLHPGRTSSRLEPTSASSLGGPHGSHDAASPPSSTTMGETDSPPLPLSEPLVRIHSECYTGETAWSARCDCGEQLDEAARLMSLPASPGGVIIYLRQEGRGIGLSEKLKAYNLQDLGSDTVEANLLLRHPADARSYGLATAMLVDLGFGSADRDGGSSSSRGGGISLLTNNPDKVRAVEGPNREVTVKRRVPMIPLAWKSGGKGGIHGREIERYLMTKVSANHVRVISSKIQGCGLLI